MVSFISKRQTFFKKSSLSCYHFNDYWLLKGSQAALGHTIRDIAARGWPPMIGGYWEMSHNGLYFEQYSTNFHWTRCYGIKLIVVQVMKDVADDSWIRVKERI
jgi:hypothetical protein